MGVINLNRLADTTHTYTGEETDEGPNTVDGNYATSWAVSYTESSGGGSNKSVSFAGLHEYSREYIGKNLTYKINISCQTTAGASFNGAQSRFSMEIYDAADSNWHTIVSADSGLIQGNASWSYSNNDVVMTYDISSYTRVTKARFNAYLYVERRDEGAGGGSEHAEFTLYEMETTSVTGSYGAVI